jgi:hypothetical protein
MLAALRRVRQAAAAGRGHERAPELERTTAPGAAREPARVATRPPARPGESRSASRIASPSHGSRYLVLGLLGGLVAVGLAVWLLRGFVLERQAPAPAASGVEKLLADAIATRVQLARRRLDACDFQAAVRDAESALKLDDKNAEARAVLEEAQVRGRAAEAAASALVAARERRGDAAAAAFELMKVAPANPDAEKAARESGAAFRPRAEEARKLAAEARAAADAAGAGGQPAFAQGDTLDKQGEQAIASDPVTAARRLLEARVLFERAARAAARR